MNKAELIAKVSEKTGVTKKDTERIVNVFMREIVEEVGRGGRVQLIRFGTFEVAKTAARVGRNPQTGEAMQIQAKKRAKFKPGKAFAEKLKA